MATAYAVPQQQVEDPAADALIQDQLQQIADRLQKLAEDQVMRKATVESRWLDDLRAFHGRYSEQLESQLLEADKSRAFVKITRKKTNSWDARLGALLFPTDEENWGINPTPVPTLVDNAKASMDAAMMSLASANEEQDPALAQQKAAVAQEQVDEASKALLEAEEAKRRADQMFKVMRDQLVECNYAAECREAIKNACRLGTGIIKGPLAGDRQRGAWAKIDGEYIYNQQTDPAPIFKNVDPWSYFPDMSATRAEDREFEFERHLWSAKDLRRLVRERGFGAAAVKELLQENRFNMPITTPGIGYLANLRAITGTSDPIKGRYIGWEYHGPLECKEVAVLLRALGRIPEAEAYETEDDPLKEVRVIVFFCDGKVLKVSPAYPLDSNESLYSIFTLEPGEASIFGYGIPSIMADSQRAMNGAWRMALDNAGLSVGPQIFIDKESIEPANRRWKLEPRKIWYKRRNSVATGQVFEVANVPNNVEEIMIIVETARKFIDDETALPVQAEGELTDNPNLTATATNFMSMASNITFRRVVKNYDDGITTPNIRRLYDWNMQHHPREDIKGDMKVDARGSSVLLVREIQSQMLLNLAQNWTVHPVLSKTIKPYETARKTLQSMMIQPDEIMPSSDDYEQAVEAEAKAAAENQPQDPAIVSAQTRLQATQIDSQTRLQVADIERETELMKLAQQMNMDIEKLRTTLQLKEIDVGSKERIFAAEAAMEEKRAREARARGEEPRGSGGSLSA